MSKDGFYVQLHLHTSESSKCGRSGGAELARACKAAGYDLIAITDHFMNANIGCDADLPWAAKVEYLFRGYHAARKEGERIGLEVIPGWETFTGGLFAPSEEGQIMGPELLTYGLDEQFLLDNPDIAEVPYYEYIRRVNEAGGCIIHAHPYRRAHYIPEFKPDPHSVEAYEVFNFHNKDPKYNELAMEEAEAHGLLKFAGSDAHHIDTIHGGAMRFDYPVHSMAEMFEAARSGHSTILPQLPQQKRP